MRPSEQSLTRRNLLLAAGAGALAVPGAGGLGAFAGPEPPSGPPPAPLPPTPEGAVRFGVISDVHQDVMHDGEHRVRCFVEAMREVAPDFVVQLGDFCVPHERNDAFLAAWNAFEGPKHHVIGNHDTDGGFTREQVVEYYGMPARYYSFDRSGVHFVVLDGNDRGGVSGGYPRFVAADQVAWLREDLASTELPTVVFIHQPLDSVAGIDNRAEVRAVLAEATRTSGHADVLAVVAGHSHIDVCRPIDGIYHLLVNSASYQWVGSKHRHQSYPPEIHAKAASLDRTCPYRDPLWSVVTVDPAERTIRIDGRSTAWVGPSPVECGADPSTGSWSWDPAYSRPRTSSWLLPFPAAGDLG